MASSSSIALPVRAPRRRYTRVAVLFGSLAASALALTTVPVSATVDVVGLTTRISTPNHYQAAVDIAKIVGNGSLNGLDRLIIVTGESFPDALSASGLAGYLDNGGRRGRTAILLARHENLPAVTDVAIRSSGLPPSRLLLVGGTDVISGTVHELIARAAGWNGEGPNPVIRIAGENRYETSAAVASYVIESAGDSLPLSFRTILVANGQQFPDAAAAGTLAYRNGHLVLLSRPTSAPPAIMQVIPDVAANCAVLLGGPTALSTSVGSQIESVLQSGGCGTDRLGGADRYETAALISSRFASENPGSGQVILVPGSDFWHSMSVAPLAGGNRSILFTTPTGLPAATSNWLQGQRGRTTGLLVVGGVSVVPNSVAQEATALITPPSSPSPTPTTSAPAPSGLSLSYSSTVFSTSQLSQSIAPSTAGASGTVSYSYSGSLPTGVTFDTSTGTFTGPSAWNFSATQIAGGVNSVHTCALLTDTTARCWGRNGNGQLGDGTTTMRTAPVAVLESGTPVTLSGITQIAVGTSHTCARLQDGTARCWGSNSNGQLGDGTSGTVRLHPVVVKSEDGSTNLTTVAEIATGGDHTCARLEDGTARCWGSNSGGRLGDGTTTTRLNPVTVLASGTATSNPVTLSAIAQILLSGTHTCARMLDDTVRCWGSNSGGRLGDGTIDNRSNPVTVLVSGTATSNPVTLSAVAWITSGVAHTCALLADTTARCWGLNSVAPRLGDGTTMSASNPVTVLASGTINSNPVTLSGVVALAAGGTSNCAAMSDGSSRCWGNNASGQLGDGTTTNGLNPVTVLSTVSASIPVTKTGLISFVSGEAHTCARTNSGSVFCWGSNGDGALGIGSAVGSSRLHPVELSGFGNPGWPSTVTVTVSDGTQSASTTITLTIQ